MSKEEQMKLVNIFFNDILSGGNLDLLDEIIHPDYSPFQYQSNYRDFQSARVGSEAGINSIKKRLHNWTKGFPDLKINFEKVIAGDESMVVIWEAWGKHMGEFLGISPTEKTIHIAGIHLFLFKNNKILQAHMSLDFLGLLTQIGKAIIEQSDEDKINDYLATLHSMGIIPRMKQE